VNFDVVPDVYTEDNDCDSSLGVIDQSSLFCGCGLKQYTRF
jgi:hypothetical protein